MLVSTAQREIIFAEIRPALRPLFVAYRVSHIGSTPLDRIPQQHWPGLGGAGFRQILQAFSADQHFAIAGCIVLLGDNLAKAYLDAASIAAQRRREYGRAFFKGVKFGSALYTGGDAFRHDEEWRAKGPSGSNAITLAQLGITQFDASIPEQILKLGNINDQDGFERQLNDFCDDVEGRLVP